MANRTHTVRIMNDMREFYEENPIGIYILPEDDNVCLIHALIIGPNDTPYENGFFYFILKFPDNYPLEPPKVELRTTNRKTVRFNPNLYADGRVCLSILGTFSGPTWNPTQTILTTLLSIQSLLSEHPYHNEPGFEKNSEHANDFEKVANYNDLIIHETLRVAVIGMLQAHSSDAYGMPVILKNIMICHFQSNYHWYEKIIHSNDKNDGKPTHDPFSDNMRPKKFRYRDLLAEMTALKEAIGLIENVSVDEYREITEKTLHHSYRNNVKRTSSASDTMFEESGDEVCVTDLYESDDDE